MEANERNLKVSLECGVPSCATIIFTGSSNDEVVEFLVDEDQYTTVRGAEIGAVCPRCKALIEKFAGQLDAGFKRNRAPRNSRAAKPVGSHDPSGSLKDEAAKAAEDAGRKG